jgi:DNA-binding HxlR family transcriptional regulator
MTSTDKKVGYPPNGKLASEISALEAGQCSAPDVEEAIKTIEGRWKMVILSQLFAQPVMRFSELERAIPAVSQKMLTQQLRELERDQIVARTVHPQVPPKVEYQLTELGRALCPALRLLLDWAGLRKQWLQSAQASGAGSARPAPGAAET